MRELSDPFQARILLVDDQTCNLRLLELALRRTGYLDVSSTTKPEEVCERHRGNRYDLIVLDLQMPRMNGFEVLAALRSEPAVTVLVLSADASQTLPALEAGANGFLSKPFVIAELVLRVRQMLGLTLDEPPPVRTTPPTLRPRANP